jgi:hypothetical protein
LLDKDKWTKLFKGTSNVFNNKCHTMNRFNCYIIGEDKMLQHSIDQTDVSKAHLYYKAVPCAKQVLSGGYIGLSFIGLSMLLALLI